jgi:hypothetical protein
VQRAVLVTGDREWTDEGKVMTALARFGSHTILIHGACRGLDRMAGEVGLRWGMDVRPFPYIGGLGRAGGPARNKQMLDALIELRAKGYETHVIAFHPNLAESKGTAGMVKMARAAGYTVEVVE